MKPAARYYSSALSQFCAERLPGDFHYLDGDEILLRYSAQPLTFARSSRIFRVLESKNPGEQLRRSQREVFPLLATAIQLAVDHKQIDEGSGVFIIEGEPPDFLDGALVRQVLPESSSRGVGIQIGADVHLDHHSLGEFIRCRR